MSGWGPRRHAHPTLVHCSVQDERVMQLFGLVNTLLEADTITHHRYLNIRVRCWRVDGVCGAVRPGLP